MLRVGNKDYCLFKHSREEEKIPKTCGIDSKILYILYSLIEKCPRFCDSQTEYLENLYDYQHTYEYIFSFDKLKLRLKYHQILRVDTYNKLTDFLSS